jgi:hypothetical protein
MGRFARSQDVTTSTGPTRRSDVIAVPIFSSKRESKSNKMKSQARRLFETRAKRMKYFWIVLVSMIGLSAGWMLGQSWISSPQDPTQIAEVVPSASIENKQSSEENTTAPSDQSDQEAQFIEQDSQQNQASDYRDQKPNKARRTRVQRANAQGGPVTMVLKPFKAINPLKLRKLRLW